MGTNVRSFMLKREHDHVYIFIQIRNCTIFLFNISLRLFYKYNCFSECFIAILLALLNNFNQGNNVRNKNKKNY